MAILMRRGKYVDFDPTKMLPGEWAVAVDADTSKQVVWMCFAAGIVKRMGTIEDFDSDIQNIIQGYMDSINNSVKICILSEKNASSSEANAKTSEINAKNNADSSATSATQSAGSATNAFSYASNASQQAINAINASNTAQSYVEQAQTTLDNTISIINEAIEMNVPKFEMDFSTGHLMWQGGRFYFMCNENTGHLEWEVM